MAMSAGGANALGAVGAEGAAIDPGVGAVNAAPGPPTVGGRIIPNASSRETKAHVPKR